MLSIVRDYFELLTEMTLRVVLYFFMDIEVVMGCIIQQNIA